MPADAPRIYLDANVLLAYVADEEDRAETVQALLDEARRGEIEVVTSTLSIAEVAYGELDQDGNLTEEGEDAIDELWTPASPIQLVDVTQALTLQARGIIRKAKTEGLGGIQGADAIHLASAVMFGCAPIFTYEDQARRTRWQQATGIDVEEPYTNTPQLGI